MEENVRPGPSNQQQVNPQLPPPGGGAGGGAGGVAAVPGRAQPTSVHALAMSTVYKPSPEDYLYDVGSNRSGSTSTRYRLQHMHSIAPPPPKKSWKKKLKDGFRAFVAFVFSKIGICVLVIAYLVVGAAMFQQLEGPAEQEVRYRVEDYRRQMVTKLWKVTEAYNTLHPANWTQEVSDIVTEYQARIIHEAREGYDGSDIPSYQWSFTGGLLYSITVITTIGYGHISPVTPVGKLVTIFYAIIGIPLFLLYLSNIGDIMAKSFKWTYSRLCKCQRAPQSQPMAATPGGILKRTEQFRIQYLPHHVHGVAPTLQGSQNGSAEASGQPQEDSTSSMASASGGGPDVMGSEYSGDENFQPVVVAGVEGKHVSLDNVTVPITLCLLVMVCYVCGGAVLFSEWEGWGFLDGSYFCFITLSTIGFGDMVPGDAVAQDDEVDQGGVAPVNTKFVLCSMYILIGMALIAMCFNLMQEKVVKGVRSLGRKLARKSMKTVGVNPGGEDSQ